SAVCFPQPTTVIIYILRGNFQLNLSGSATPPSPPAMSVSARASGSTDGGIPTSPLFSPNRSNIRPHLSRMYRPGMRSLDSGLDLSSPTIGHHALFIKEHESSETSEMLRNYKLAICLAKEIAPGAKRSPQNRSTGELWDNNEADATLAIDWVHWFS
ncbi:hypothetical protein OSTOST_14992, partial [Ostertagia ostertagi]